MAWRGRAIAILLGAALAPLAGIAAADHTDLDCPPFQRLRYDYLVEFHHGGDLFSEVHVVGFTDFRFCYEIRDRLLREEIRWESRGGEYVLHVVGEGFEHTHSLRQGQNQTAWYAHREIDYIQAVGLSHDLKPTLIPQEPPPARSEAPNPLARLPLAWP